MKISLFVSFLVLLASAVNAQEDKIHVPLEKAKKECLRAALEIGQKVSEMNVPSVKYYPSSLKAELREEKNDYPGYSVTYKVTMSGAEDTTVIVNMKVRRGEVESPCVVDSLEYFAD
mgnify:CR=1 FL=1